MARVLIFVRVSHVSFQKHLLVGIRHFSFFAINFRAPLNLRKRNHDIYDPLFAKSKIIYYGIAKITNTDRCAEESKSV